MAICAFRTAFLLLGGTRPLRGVAALGDIPEDTGESPIAETPAPNEPEPDPGPVRLVRFTLVSAGENGSVTWRGGSEGDWADAAINQPLRQGAQISTSDQSSAEIQFDDGSRIGLMPGTIISRQTLFIDSKGEFTEIALHNGKIDSGKTDNDRRGSGRSVVAAPEVARPRANPELPLL